MRELFSTHCRTKVVYVYVLHIQWTMSVQGARSFDSDQCLLAKSLAVTLDLVDSRGVWQGECTQKRVHPLRAQRRRHNVLYIVA